jgi:hypothetical protein
MPGDVQRRKIRTTTVREQVHPIEPEVLPQSLNVIDKPVTAIGSGICWNGRLTSAPQIQHDQLPMRRQTPELTKVNSVLHRPTRQTDHRIAHPEHVEGQLGPIVCGEVRHGEDPVSAAPAKATDYLTAVPASRTD